MTRIAVWRATACAWCGYESSRRARSNSSGSVSQMKAPSSAGVVGEPRREPEHPHVGVPAVPPLQRLAQGRILAAGDDHLPAAVAGEGGQGLGERAGASGNSGATMRDAWTP